MGDYEYLKRVCALALPLCFSSCESSPEEPADADDGAVSSNGSTDADADSDGAEETGRADPTSEATSGSDDATGGDESGEDATSRCVETPSGVTCSYETLPLVAMASEREVHYQVPIGSPPAQGWPVVVFFQGSLVSGEKAFSAGVGAAFGQYHLALTIKALLDAGYAVLAPEALDDGTTYWQTNVLPWSVDWASSSDHALMLAMFEALEEARFGPVDVASMYAMGISSGGFMTSRMAVSYPGRFRALVVHSASYATCGPMCTMPITRPLPSDHPPTLLLHGAADLIVPVETMELYRDALLTDGIEVLESVDPDAGHVWLESGPKAVLSWFQEHP